MVYFKSNRRQNPPVVKAVVTAVVTDDKTRADAGQICVCVIKLNIDCQYFLN